MLNEIKYKWSQHVEGGMKENDLAENTPPSLWGCEMDV